MSRERDREKERVGAGGIKGKKILQKEEELEQTQERSITNDINSFHFTFNNNLRCILKRR